MFAKLMCYIFTRCSCTDVPASNFASKR